MFNIIKIFLTSRILAPVIQQAIFSNQEDEIYPNQPDPV